MPTDLRAVVFMNQGLWVARCPRPLCTNAERFGRCADGSVGGLTGSSFWCRDVDGLGGCGLRCPADWPSNIEKIEQMVLCRPVPASRNWEPGETLHDLLAENIGNGIVPLSPAELEAARTGELLPGGGKIFEMIGDEVTVGGLGSSALPAIEGGDG